ncbi:MAG: ABC transporter permease [Micrococcaceae bacterium]
MEKLGAGKYALPALAVALVGCVMALLFYPMLNMAPKDLPFAVLSLDEGASTPQGEINAGAMVVEQLTSSDTTNDDAAPIAWTQVDTQEELDAALANNELYGALTVPADFTQQQAAAQAEQASAPRVDVVLDHAKSPLMATQLQTSMGSLFAEQGLEANISVINTGPADSSSASPMASMMSQQIGVMPLMMMSLIGSVLLTRLFPRGAASSTGSRFAVLGRQLGYAAGVSLLVGLVSVWLLNGLVGAAAPFWTTTLFLWLASIAVMALFLGAFNLATPIGVLAVLGLLIGGMMTGVLTAEVLPAFWADWIQPWAPQAFIGEGLRDILYRGAELLPRGGGGLLALGGVGLGLVAVAGLLPRRQVRA